MSDSWIDLREDGEAAQIILMKPPAWIQASIYLFTALLIALLIWAYTGSVDTYITARGVVRPKGDLVRVQPMVGGRLMEVLVTEGDFVAQGDVLFRIEGKETGTELKKMESRIESGKTQLAFLQSSRKQILRQHDLEKGRDEIDIERAEWALKKARSDLAKSEAVLTVWEARLLEADAQFKRMEQLLEDNIISREDFEGKKMGFDVARAQRDSAAAEVETARHEISLLQRSRDLKKKQAQAAEEEGNRDREEIERKVAILEQEIEEFGLEQGRLEEKLSDFEVTAPLAGTITEVANHGAGEVVRSGDVIAHIAPEKVPWIVEAHVPNRDAGPLQERVGGKVKLKFDPYPFRDFGALDGKLLRVSPDAIDHPTLGMVYRVEVGLDSIVLRRGQRKGKVALGMTASVEIEKEKIRFLSLFFREIRDRVSYDG